MNERKIPEAIEAEKALLGAILLRESIMRDLLPVLDASDFYKPIHQVLYGIMCDLWDAGHRIDPIAVHGINGDVTMELLAGLTVVTPSVSAFGTYADLVIEASRRRRLLGHYATQVDALYGGADVDALLDADPSGDRLIAPRSAEIRDLHNVAEFMARRQQNGGDDGRPWLIPHLLKALWRVILVAPEGWGKAVLMRMLAVHAAAGRDPWQPHYRCEPRRVLYVDVENAESSIGFQFDLANRATDYDVVAEYAENFWLWHREGGIDLRQRRPLAELEAVIQKVRPEIVFAGPLYKLFRRGKGEDAEQAALEFVEVLDELRVRYGFALMLEHHAPKGTAGSRDLNPFGTSLWMRWPEFGLTMEPNGNVEPDEEFYEMKLGRFRRDREIADWPQELHRRPNQVTPWQSYFEKGRGTKLGLWRDPMSGEWTPRPPGEDRLRQYA